MFVSAHRLQLSSGVLRHLNAGTFGSMAIIGGTENDMSGFRDTGIGPRILTHIGFGTIGCTDAAGGSSLKGTGDRTNTSCQRAEL